MISSSIGHSAVLAATSSGLEILAAAPSCGAHTWVHRACHDSSTRRKPCISSIQDTAASRHRMTCPYWRSPGSAQPERLSVSGRVVERWLWPGRCDCDCGSSAVLQELAGVRGSGGPPTGWPDRCGWRAGTASGGPRYAEPAQRRCWVLLEHCPEREPPLADAVADTAVSGTGSEAVAGQDDAAAYRCGQGADQVAEAAVLRHGAGRCSVRERQRPALAVPNSAVRARRVRLAQVVTAGTPRSVTASR